MADGDGYLVARIVIERRISDDDDRIDFTAEDGDGNDLALVETLGMLHMSSDTAIRLAMGETNG